MQVTNGLLFVLFFIASAFSADAHHSLAMYDRARTQTISGTFKSWVATNPHSWFLLDTIDSLGMPTTWSLEMGSANLISRMGWDTLIQAGDKVTATFHPHKEGSQSGQFLFVTLPNGQVLKLEAGPTGRGVTPGF